MYPYGNYGNYFGTSTPVKGGRIPTPGYSGTKTQHRTTAESRTLNQIPLGRWLPFCIENTSDKVQDVILFDADGEYQLATGQTNDPSVIITGQNKNYQAILNRLAKYGVEFNQINMKVCCDNEEKKCGGLVQFSHVLKLYKHSLTDDTAIPVANYYPGMGVNSGQYNTNMVEFAANGYLEASTVMKTKIEPGCKVIIEFFLVAEFGRHH